MASSSDRPFKYMQVSQWIVPPTRQQRASEEVEQEDTLSLKQCVTKHVLRRMIKEGRLKMPNQEDEFDENIERMIEIEEDVIGQLLRRAKLSDKTALKIARMAALDSPTMDVRSLAERARKLAITPAPKTVDTVYVGSVRELYRAKERDDAQPATAVSARHVVAASSSTATAHSSASLARARLLTTDYSSTSSASTPDASQINRNQSANQKASPLPVFRTGLHVIAPFDRAWMEVPDDVRRVLFPRNVQQPRGGPGRSPPPKYTFNFGGRRVELPGTEEVTERTSELANLRASMKHNTRFPLIHMCGDHNDSSSRLRTTRNPRWNGAPLLWTGAPAIADHRQQNISCCYKKRHYALDVSHYLHDWTVDCPSGDAFQRWRVYDLGNTGGDFEIYNYAICLEAHADALLEYFPDAKRKKANWANRSNFYSYELVDKLPGIWANEGVQRRDAHLHVGVFHPDKPWLAYEGFWWQE